jgi:hypothetical protein
MLPLYLAPQLKGGGERRANVSSLAEGYLSDVGAEPDALFHHALAVLHAPAYRAANAGALKQDWPRVPLPPDAAALHASAELGRRIAALLDVERAVDGVTTGAIRPEVQSVAVPRRSDGGQLTADDLRVTARWGYTGHVGQVMPGRGLTVATTLAASVPDVLGPGALSVHLNEHACWSGVPDAVWGYTLGGYAVLKKWLSYRESDVLGRALRPDEIETFRSIARRIAALLLLDDALDANYDRACGGEEA